MSKLTDREREILIAIGETGGVKGAAVRLGLNDKYISQRLMILRRKLSRAVTLRNQLLSMKRKYPVLRRFLPEIPEESEWL